MKRVVRRRAHVPIYDATVWIVVSPDLNRARAKFDGLFGEFPIEGDCALVSWNGRSTFGIFFSADGLKDRGFEMVGHEVFHLTHRILEWAGTNFDSVHHEHAALLHGYLLDLIVKALK